ncbi:MAG: hypothetical protein M2R45_02147 [Verrucomicrobia subdivision 3 bacterium]|nr:hypothetical protein [Limisphaerales bacterium]MCS1413724.1 hypothetical protein [Limisphaerales bacterium]
MRRFRRVIESLTNATEPDWCDIAVTGNYYDQAHFIHELKAFCGYTPTEYLKQQTNSATTTSTSTDVVVWSAGG